MDVKPFICELCSKAFRRKVSFDYHLKTHEEKSFFGGTNLTNRRCTIKKEKDVVEEASNAESHMESAVDDYLQKKIENKRFICKICKRKFQNKCNLAKHSETHKTEKLLSCKTCKEKFTSVHTLRSHLSLGNKCYVCHICKKKISVKCHLTVHLRTHTKVKLESLNIHADEQPLHSIACEKSFSDEKNLDLHLHSHNDENPDIYNLHEEVSSHQSALNNHLQIPPVEKLFFCEKCEKNFASEHVLEFHSCAPVEGKFVCEQCNSFFSTISNLRLHVQCVHSRKAQFVCHVCKKEFFHMSHLEMHQQATNCSYLLKVCKK